MNLKNFGSALILASTMLAASSEAAVARLVMTGPPGEPITQGETIDNLYSWDARLNQDWNFVLFNNVGADAEPATDYLSFFLIHKPWEYVDFPQVALLNFATDAMGVPMTAGVTYANAERIGLAPPGQPGLDIAYDHRGCSALNGSFTVNALSFAGREVDVFDVSFSQSCDGGPMMEGRLSYNASQEVPEPASLALLGLGALGLGVARRRRQAR